MSTKTPSMDDKDVPSPPTRSQAQYEADTVAGVHPWGRSYDRTSWADYAARCKAVGVEPEDIDERELAKIEAGIAPR